MRKAILKNHQSKQNWISSTRLYLENKKMPSRNARFMFVYSHLSAQIYVKLKIG